MSYGSYATPEIAVTNALKIMKENGIGALKLQGGREMFDIIKTAADAGVPTMSHVGLLPPAGHHSLKAAWRAMRLPVLIMA